MPKYSKLPYEIPDLELHGYTRVSRKKYAELNNMTYSNIARTIAKGKNWGFIITKINGKILIFTKLEKNFKNKN